MNDDDNPMTPPGYKRDRLMLSGVIPASNAEVTAMMLMHEGTILAEHDGKDRDRQHCGLVEGRPWLYPGELVVEHNGSLYVIRRARCDGPFKRQDK